MFCEKCLRQVYDPADVRDNQHYCGGKIVSEKPSDSVVLAELALKIEGLRSQVKDLIATIEDNERRRNESRKKP